MSIPEQSTCPVTTEPPATEPSWASRPRAPGTGAQPRGKLVPAWVCGPGAARGSVGDWALLILPPSASATLDHLSLSVLTASAQPLRLCGEDNCSSRVRLSQSEPHTDGEGNAPRSLKRERQSSLGLQGPFHRETGCTAAGRRAQGAGHKVQGAGAEVARAVAPCSWEEGAAWTARPLLRKGITCMVAVC